MKKILLSLVCSLLCLCSYAGADRTEAWIRSRFIDSRIPPFSFKLDGVSSDEFIGKWSRKMTLKASDGNVNRLQCVYTSPDKTLRLSCDIDGYKDFQAVEWTLHFTNISGDDSPQITDVKAADLTFSAPRRRSGVRYDLYTARGTNANDRDFHLETYEILPDSLYRYVPSGGRPSSKTAFPYYNIATSTGGSVTGGTFFSIGWTGTWFAEFSKNSADALEFAAGMNGMDLYLHPGESIRTPLVSVMFWEGTDRIDGNNKFRRFVLAHHSPKNAAGELIRPPFCAGFDAGDPAPCEEYEAITEELAIAVVRRLKQIDMIPEIMWLDAGWYQGNEGGKETGNPWYTNVGNWMADDVRFPRGLKPLSDYIHNYGAGFMVWLEPERVYVGSKWEREHPEWMLSHPKSGKHRILNLGNPDACDFLCKFMSDFFEENGVDHYRQDFNINPDKFWEATDEPGRKGMTEIRYVEGLYRFYDYLREKFPDMLLDNCSSGGRRLDLEMTSRTMPLWRTDCNYGEPTAQQCHEYGLSQFLPLHGTGTRVPDNYCIRSGLSSASLWSGEVLSRANAIADIQHLKSTYFDLREYYLKDFYPLSGDGEVTGKDKWIAWQFHDPADGSGFVMAFRRDEAPESEYTVAVRALDPDASYEVYDEDKDSTVIMTGRELSAGLTITLDKPRSSVLLRYRVK